MINQFQAMRADFLPEQPKLIIVAESPGPSGLRTYFYNPSGTRDFYGPIMEAAVSCGAVSPAILGASKRDGLLAAKAVGLMVKDITDDIKNFKGEALKAALPQFMKELEALPNAKQIPLVVTPLRIKNIAVPPLRNAGFNVLGAVAFPGVGNQRKFRDQFCNLVRGVWP